MALSFFFAKIFLMPEAILLLEDGTHYKGKAVGKIGTTTGEIAFNTGMTGYQEIFTDPSYFGQILLMTPSHIGNYGVHVNEVESESIKISGLVCKKFSDGFSRPSAIESLQTYFERDGIVGISDVDTRALVRHIRDKGAMNCIISSEEFDLEKLNKQLSDVPKMEGLELSSKVSTQKPYYVGNEKASLHVAVIDYGVKQNILRCLEERGCYMKVFPCSATKEEIFEWDPDGIMLSNGPGDPSAMENEINEVAKLLKLGIPTFGICLGHQIMALASGLNTKKMHNGHRGVNHPILNLISGKGEITSQNHGFVVDENSLDKNKDAVLTHRHLNDNSVAGIKYPKQNAFSVQYHPESSAGPNDSRYLFDNFIELIKKYKLVKTS